jgi:hypothetical protein
MIRLERLKFIWRSPSTFLDSAPPPLLLSPLSLWYVPCLSLFSVVISCQHSSHVKVWCKLELRLGLLLPLHQVLSILSVTVSFQLLQQHDISVWWFYVR